MFLLFLLLASPIGANEKTQSITDEAVKVENDQSALKSITVATVQHVPTSSIYVVRGKVRYENVEGIAYLEMWNIFPDGSRYFSRTLGEYGPMQSIRGTSDWRDFELPFNLMDEKLESITLEINVVMPGKGTIKLSAMTISDSSEWFSDRANSYIGGILGTLCGLYGALFGTVAGLLVPQGKGRFWVMGLLFFGLVMGIILLILGIYAFYVGQAYHVYYPFASCGAIMTFLMLIFVPTMRKEYAKAELRKIQALDV